MELNRQLVAGDSPQGSLVKALVGVRANDTQCDLMNC